MTIATKTRSCDLYQESDVHMMALQRTFMMVEAEVDVRTDAAVLF